MKTRLRSATRSRWAAIGAAIAVSLGGGGVFIAGAATSAPSSVVTIDPLRILDTRDPVNVGLPGPFVSPVSQKLTVTGPVATTSGTATVVPAGATGVLLNVTAVGPTAEGFISIRPGDATGAPSTSSLNFSVNETAPNSVQVGLPTTGANAGKIDITFDALGTPGPTTDVLIDVVGYLVPGSGVPGPQGPAGVTNVIIDSGAPLSTAAVAQGDFGDQLGGTLIRNLTLPAGSYDITATTSVRGAPTGGSTPDIPHTRVRCNLVNATAASNLDTFYQDFFRADEPSPGYREELQVGAVVTFAAATTVELRCYSFHGPGSLGTGDGSVPSSKIVATQVATITQGS
jgi:hypothetical protein